MTSQNDGPTSRRGTRQARRRHAGQVLPRLRFRDRMAGESPVLRMLFANWGRVPAVTAIYRQRDEAKSAAP